MLVENWHDEREEDETMVFYFIPCAEEKLELRLRKVHAELILTSFAKKHGTPQFSYQLTDTEL